MGFHHLDGSPSLHPLERRPKMKRQEVSHRLYKTAKGSDDEHSQIPTREQVVVNQIDPRLRRHCHTSNRQPVSVRVRVGNSGSGVVLRRPSFHPTSRWWAQRPSQKEQRMLDEIKMERSGL
jgi:hypothetical protein